MDNKILYLENYKKLLELQKQYKNGEQKINVFLFLKKFFI